MTRQVALGAVIAFAVTVLALSVWEPKAVLPPPAPPAPANAPIAPLVPLDQAFRPVALKPDAVGRLMRKPMMVQAVDAGAPTP